MLQWVSLHHLCYSAANEVALNRRLSGCVYGCISGTLCLGQYPLPFPVVLLMMMYCYVSFEGVCYTERIPFFHGSF